MIRSYIDVHSISMLPIEKPLSWKECCLFPSTSPPAMPGGEERRTSSPQWDTSYHGLWRPSCSPPWQCCTGPWPPTAAWASTTGCSSYLYHASTSSSSQQVCSKRLVLLQLAQIGECEITKHKIQLINDSFHSSNTNLRWTARARLWLVLHLELQEYMHMLLQGQGARRT